MSTDFSGTGPAASGASPTPQRAHEVVVARLRSHGRVLFWPGLILVAMVGALGYLFGTFDELWMNVLLAVVCTFVIVVLWVLPLITWLGRNYTITTRRLIVRNGTFVRVRQELLHSRGYDVTVRQNALQSMFGSGDVEINTGLEHPVILKDVPEASLVQAALHDLMERSVSSVAARRQQEQASPDETTRWGYR
jgi:uncharacterized membrane protein YdbT with pleckstrin-like domain